MIYQELSINTANEELRQILMAELAEIGYESFIEEEDKLKAYIPQTLFREEALQELLPQYQIEDYQQQEMPDENWNAKWEADYEPVFIGEECLIKSSFHQIEKTYPYEILINPKMSFGTGHHATTSLMIAFQLMFADAHQNAKVIDAGCGTGVLAIMAEKLGARQIIAYDTDEWAVKNTQENIELNHCQEISVYQGSVETLSLEGQQQIILANINRNVLLQEIPHYAKLLAPAGLLLLSGFYEADQASIQQIAESEGLSLKANKTQNDWLSLVFENTNKRQ